MTLARRKERRRTRMMETRTRPTVDLYHDQVSSVFIKLVIWAKNELHSFTINT